GLMSTFAGIGALTGSLIIASVAHIPKRGLVQAGCGAVLGLGLMLFGLSSSFPVALGCLMLAGLAGAGFQTLNSAMMMATAEPGYYGRVSSINQLNFSLSNMVVLPLGVIVDQLGAPTVMFFAGAFVVLFWVFVMVFVKSYREIE